ncbi:MAG: hypothetical protein ABGX16_22965 [Pirellulales bacterium]
MPNVSAVALLAKVGDTIATKTAANIVADLRIRLSPKIPITSSKEVLGSGTSTAVEGR